MEKEKSLEDLKEELRELDKKYQAESMKIRSKYIEKRDKLMQKIQIASKGDK